MNSLIHGDGQPGGLVEVGVDVSEVGGVVMLNMRILNCEGCVRELTLSGCVESHI